MAKIGFTAHQVWEMSHLEANAWIESVLESQGVKPSPNPSSEQTTIISMRKPRH